MTNLDDLLAVPVAPATRKPRPTHQFTSQLELSGDTATAEVRGLPSETDESAARELLRRKGEDPNDWVAISYRSSEWTLPSGELGESNRYTFARVGTRAAELATAGGAPSAAELAELFAAARGASSVQVRPAGDHGLIVALGDLQVGKIDGDGVEGTIARAIQYINQAAGVLGHYRARYSIGHVHLAWLGDHIEGFVSQGGANVWRTPLTLNEQLRIVRRLMLYAIEVFAPLANRLTVVAVPGNHGEPQRFTGKGVTRYSDSHDTEALVAVSEAIALNPAAFGHVETYVPTGDDMTVTLEVAGTVVSHVHGHQFRPGQYMKWWQGQSFGGSPLGQADLLLAGHLHHFHIDTSGARMFLQVPALESESTWWKNSTGEDGCPGLVVAVTKDGLVSPIEVIR